VSPESSRWGSSRHRRAVALVVFACCLAAPSAALAATTANPTSHRAITATREILILCLAGLVLPSAFLWDMLIGKDKRVSTSKTTAAVWTYLIASALLGFVVAKLIGHPQGLDKMMHSGLAGQYGLLIGGPLGAAVAAKGIVTNQVAKNPAAKTPSPDGPSLSQLVQNDTGETDLGDLQYVLFNFVPMVYFVGTLVQSPTDGFPHIPDVLLGLTSISALGYVTKKALPTTAATAKLNPTTAAAGATVTITGTGLLAADDPSNAPVIVLFGTGPATVGPRGRADGTDSIEVTVPQGLVQGKAVDVFVITPTPARVNAGSFTAA
jgi:hypothetical protein